jgi:hypothetical protein
MSGTDDDASLRRRRAAGVHGALERAAGRRLVVTDAPSRSIPRHPAWRLGDTIRADDGTYWECQGSQRWHLYTADDVLLREHLGEPPRWWVRDGERVTVG